MKESFTYKFGGTLHRKNKGTKESVRRDAREEEHARVSLRRHRREPPRRRSRQRQPRRLPHHKRPRGSHARGRLLHRGYRRPARGARPALLQEPLIHARRVKRVPARKRPQRLTRLVLAEADVALRALLVVVMMSVRTAAA